LILISTQYFSHFARASWRRKGPDLWSVLPVLPVLAILGLAGCAHTGPATPPASVVWPPPPDEPRVRFVSAISQPADFGFKSSGWSKVANWIIGAPVENQKFRKPFGLGLDESDNLCLTDTGANVVWFFDLAQSHCQRWEKVGKLRFLSPVAVAKRGNTIFVADSALGSVIAFDTKGKLLFEIKRELQRPVGLAISNGQLFVADSQLNAIVVFDLNGRFLRQFGERGGGPGEFNFPTHVTVDAQGSVLVTDSMNGRIQRLDPQGKYESRIGSPGDSSGHFSRPKGVAMDSQGHVYVVDGLFGNIQIFNSEGQLLLALGGVGSKPGEFWLPNGIAISHDNRIFVADSYNRRMQILKYVGGAQ
jgi:DNA-binding beta-propeller fold protein YncE